MSDTFDLSKYGGSSGTDNSDPSATFDLSKYSAPGTSDSPSANVPTFDLSKYGGASADTPQKSGGWNGILDNPIGRGIGDATKGVLNFAGNTLNTLEHLPVINQVGGAMKGLEHGYFNYTPDPSSPLDFGLGAVGNSFKEGWQGLLNPDQARQNVQNDIVKPLTDPKIPAILRVANTVGEGINDPLSVLPVGAIGKGISKLSDVAGLTPHVSNLIDYINKSKLVDNGLVNGVKDKLGTMFTKNYGSSPDLTNILDSGSGNDAMNQNNILNALKDLSQGHGLTPDELNQTGHVIEGTMQGTPEQQAFAQKWSNLAFHGPGGADMPIPQAASEIPKVNPDVSLNAVTPKQFPPISRIAEDNSIKPLSTYTDTLYRESSPQNALDLIPGINSSTEMKGDQVFFSNNKDLALGQGTNKGVTIEFSPDGIQGHVNTSKPTWQHSYNNGDAEFVGRYNNQGAYKDAVKSVTIQPNTKMDKVTQMQLNRALSSWEQVKNPDGSVTYLRPNENVTNLKPDSVQTAVPNTPNTQTASAFHQNGAIGTNAMLHTASAVNGEPLLQSQLPDYFKHMYDNVPDELKGVFPKQEQGVSGLSPNGTFNLPRTFATLQDAQNAGLKPELDPFQVLGSHLSQSSKALTNNEVISQIKNTPGILFPKDPIDEVAKLVKTGRMTADQAAQQLGMTLDDLKKGFVQSKVPQLSGAYIRPADEAALVEHLNPAQPTGPFALFNKLNNLFNKGYLLNPAPHLHNVYTNGVGLGDANLGHIKDTLDALKNGQANPWYDRAMQSGAMSNPTNGKFSDAIDRAVTPQGGNLLSRTLDATKGAATNIATGNGKLLDNLMAPFQPARNASHDLLWNNDAAIRTSLFRGAVENGATDVEAAAHTNKFMVDYNNLTPFEKQYVKPLINFYAWKKGNTPLQLSQTLAQTPKYALYGHAKDAISQALSGQPTDPEGRINSGNTLPDGSHTMVDPYSPMDEINKIGNKGLVQFIYNSLNPIVKEAISQGTSLAQLKGLPIQNKFPIYNPAAPLGYNIKAGAAHAINALNPLNSSAVLGQGVNQSNLINKEFGMPTNNKPDQTMLDLIMKLLGGFTATNNPGKDALTQHYQAKDNQVNLRKYIKNVGKANQN